MDRVKYGRKRWRSRWPWRWFFPPTVDERFCRKCGLPYQNGVHPKEEEQFRSNNVGALVYPAGGWKRGEVAVKFGRWKSHGRDFYLSQYFSPDEVDDLIKVAERARKYLKTRRSKKRRSH